MAAKILLLVALVGLTLAQSTSCPASAFSCVGTANNQCGYSGIGTSSISTSQCSASANLFCTGALGLANGVCQAAIALGGTCNQSSLVAYQCGYTGAQCLLDTPASTTATCLLRYALPGQVCTADSQCYYDNANGGTNSTCVSGRCYGAVGTACTSPSQYSHQCASGSYCNATYLDGGFCVASHANGANCTTPGTDNSCSSGYCLTSKVCGARFQGGAGASCSDSDECQDGFFCAANGKNADNTCHARVASSGIACTGTDSTPCNNFESCRCNSAYAQVCQLANTVNPTGNAAATIAQEACQIANPICQQTQLCSQCQNQECEAAKLSSNGQGFSDQAKCYLTQAEQNIVNKVCLSTSGASTVAASAVVIVAALALLM